MELTNNQISEHITHHKQTRVIKGLVVPLNEINHYNKNLRQKGLALDIPNLPRIVAAGADNKMILLREDISNEQMQDEQCGFSKFKIEEIPLELTYKNFDNQQILNWFTQVSKTDQQGYVAFPGSFETIGHIAHYNLTEEQQKWKKAIGETTLMKCPNIKTVVNKTQKLHNVYRTPTLEHMAGDHSYEATLKERGVQFRINFEKVYWCSRLQQERDRVLDLMRAGEVLVDLFCGVGPLAVRAAKKGLFVIANDLNPYCHEYLQVNSKINKVESKMLCWNMCARQAMRKVYKQHNELPKSFQDPDHIYMNLPVDAIEFLDVLVDYEQHIKTNKKPMVHVNCFVVADSDEKSLELLAVRIKKVLPYFRAEQIEHMHHIKNVTVIMRMYCISFRLKPIPQNNNKEEQQGSADNNGNSVQVGHGTKKTKTQPTIM